IIHSIATNGRVVEIPGYRNFLEFSRDWEDQIQYKLQKWQLVDGFLKQAWFGNISTSPQLPPPEMEKKIIQVAKQVHEKKQITWIMLNYPGITAHAWLVLDVNRAPNGLRFTYLDSNHPGKVMNETYLYGNSFINTDMGRAAIYIGRTKDFQRISKVSDRYCGGDSRFDESEELDNELGDEGLEPSLLINP
ncbi:MAG: hypothetical protein IT289_02200, partial [Oligoflexia bacterium]|nr:hypothetical protein [Oligoflexia bacterium]